MSYSTFYSQGSMAFDTYRNELYAQAIRNVVTPDSVVLDLGAGIGILGLIAALAGAKRVYLVEPEPIINTARAIAKANDLEDRIIILQGKIEDVELPEKVDVIISVFTGNLLFSEDLLPSLYFARDNYLKPEGRLIPDKAELYLAPVSAPKVYERQVEKWSKPQLELNLSTARRFAANEIIYLDRKADEVEKLNSGVIIQSLDLTNSNTVDCNGKTACKINVSGLSHGLICWIKIRLDDAWLSTELGAPKVHWSPAVLPFDPPLQLTSDETISIELHRLKGGDWTWSAKTASGSRKHSTFLSRLGTLQHLRKIEASHTPTLTLRGNQARAVLELIEKGLSFQGIVGSLMSTSPDLFENYDIALETVQQIVLQYGK